MSGLSLQRVGNARAQCPDHHETKTHLARTPVDDWNRGLGLCGPGVDGTVRRAAESFVRWQRDRDAGCDVWARASNANRHRLAAVGWPAVAPRVSEAVRYVVSELQL